MLLLLFFYELYVTSYTLWKGHTHATATVQIGPVFNQGPMCHVLSLPRDRLVDRKSLVPQFIHENKNIDPLLHTPGSVSLSGEQLGFKNWSMEPHSAQSPK